MLGTVLIWIVVGIIAGWLTSLVVKGRGYGLLGRPGQMWGDL
jgi:uncharacterized membrane protein YeaQ/YmgE (transglycosylase-associated protein family)